MKTLIKIIYLGDVQGSELIIITIKANTITLKIFIYVLRFDRRFYRVMLDCVTFAQYKFVNVTKCNLSHFIRILLLAVHSFVDFYG